MSGYDKSPDYQSDGGPPWTDWAALVVVIAVIGGLAWFGLAH